MEPKVNYVVVGSFVALLGAILFVVSGLVGLKRRRIGARIALLAATCVWSFYLPATVEMIKIQVSDQALDLQVFKQSAPSSPES